MKRSFKRGKQLIAKLSGEFSQQSLSSGDEGADTNDVAVRDVRLAVKPPRDKFHTSVSVDSIMNGIRTHGLLK